MEFFSPRFQYTFSATTPVLEISPGTKLCVVCPDSDNVQSDGTALPADRRQVRSGYPQTNPVAGPINVRGAEPGDTLIVRIDAIHLDRATGQTGLAPANGLLSGDLLLRDEPAGTQVPKHLFQWTIDTDANLARVSNPLSQQVISVPLDPFVGCIGVCPDRDEEIATLYSGTFGGNMDIPLLRPRTTLFLPVFHSGALLSMGDLHAAQGHGEIIGGAIETSGRIECTIDLGKGSAIEAPRMADVTHRSAVGVDSDLRNAIAKAYAHLLNWMVEDFEINRWDAYNLISQCGSIVMGNLLAPPYPVAARISQAIWDQYAKG